MNLRMDHYRNLSELKAFKLHTHVKHKPVLTANPVMRDESVWALATQSDSWGTRQESADDSGSKRPWKLGRPVGTWGTYRAPALG